MARFAQVLIGTGPDVDQKVTVASGNSSAAILIGKNRAFVVVAYGAAAGGSGGVAIAFGSSTVAAPTASNYQFPVSQQTTFDTGFAFTNIRFFNNTGVSVDIYIKPLGSE